MLATALAYSTFGLGGLLIYCFYPFIIILPITKADKRRLGRKIVHLSFKFFIFLLKTLGILSYETSQIEKLQEKGQLIIANHPSLIDVVFLLSFIPDTNCIVRESLLRNPFTRGPIKTAGYIGNNDSELLLTHCVNSLKAGDSLIIFPEGTRTKPEKSPKFKKGAAYMALLAEKDLTPVFITCQPSMLSKGVKWYDIPKTKPHFKIWLENNFKVNDYLDDDSHLNVKSRRLTNDLLGFYKEKLGD